MKEINELNIEDNLLYAEDHEWVKQEGENAVIGISDYAQDRLGDLVFVELPEIGSVFDKGDEFGSIESVKAVSDLYMPIGGEIIEINESLADTPENVNNSPYEKGWMIKIKIMDSAQLKSLMDKDTYIKQLEG
ncbi:MAG: glycine cleavage system protein GcvH [Deltaproteobacteria bacterium]|nr:glycine cleavage system protein GcvH [Deltaproteobacteria bacterium]